MKFERKIDDDLVRIEFEEDVLVNSVIGVDFIDRKNLLLIEETLNELTEIPKSITRIAFQIIPTKDSKYYMNFDGIETILYNLFKTENNKMISDLGKFQAVLKPYYKRQKDTFYSIPILNIEIIFMGKLNQKTYHHIGQILSGSNGFLGFTSQTGEIEYVEIKSKKDLENILNIKLLMGQEEFKLEGIFQKNGFSLDAIKELNQIFIMGILPLELREIIIGCAETFLNAKECIGESTQKDDEEDDFNNEFENLPF